MEIGPSLHPAPPEQRVSGEVHSLMAEGSTRRVEHGWEHLQARTDGQVAIVELGAAPLNLLSQRVRHELDEALTWAETCGCRAFVLLGTERAFSAGSDIREFADELSYAAGLDRAQRELKALRRLSDSPLVTISVVRGYALGGGCELALSCDICLAERTALLGFPEVKIGGLPLLGIWHLVHRAGLGKALGWLLTGATLTATQALEAGVVFEVAEPEQGERRALELANVIANFSPVAVRSIKQLARLALNEPLEPWCDAMAAHLGTAFSSRAFADGIRSFLDRKSSRAGQATNAEPQAGGQK